MIYLSAGHYPAAAGACFGDFCEHAEAVRWVAEISGLIDVIVVPTGSLSGKVQFINTEANEHDIAVEIHFNSAVDANNKHVGQGSETLYMPGSVRGVTLATKMQAALGAVMPPNRGAKEGYYQMDRSKRPDFFLVKTVCTALIIEPEFIHHKELIQSRRAAACHAIAEVLEAT